MGNIITRLYILVRSSYTQMAEIKVYEPVEDAREIDIRRACIISRRAHKMGKPAKIVDLRKACSIPKYRKIRNAYPTAQLRPAGVDLSLYPNYPCLNNMD